ncbi:aspartoacylase [Synechococcus sp. CS-197]|uniref:aspartoacylase n=1 Tax=Synechococcus sp. CS-197 TaxID=2847985 RepID=UPI00031BBA85|nr:aspartoacylase [Synechococcus sp. CS-197]MCT0249923.1 aspartoacylase [Synechococcus sp. CS-197]PTT95453.1 aspartoacylase [Pseudomonas sp. HMWF031]
MVRPRVLVVAGTHGNEINGPWLLDQWRQHPNFVDSKGLDVQLAIGNPAACAQGRRYLDRDLNRSFRSDLLERASTVPAEADREMLQALALLQQFGPEGQTPCDLVVDLHSTTSAMGNCLVVYGRRPVDLALAALVQHRLGLPIYLHEADAAQQGFLAERWPCGLVIEVGPVPQNVRRSDIVLQTRLALEALMAAITSVRDGTARYPDQVVIHRHLGSLDVPRRRSGDPDALVHPNLQGRDWQPLKAGDPLFINAESKAAVFEGEDGLIPVFINEAAYAEKAIALSFTKREAWPLPKDWKEALANLLG